MADIPMEVRGRDLNDGLPKTITVVSSQIETAIKESIYKIVDIVKINYYNC